MKAAEVRRRFISFFEEKGHSFAAGSPVVIPSDPTLLFANAGMNQFKDVFLGTGTRPYTRATNSQLCIRVSGKHNDLEEVGHDTYHQTLFEMLGNWSFGDYYKKEAIEWSWELLTEVYGLPKAKLFATVYEDDDETAELWKTVTDINPQHIIKCGKKDNFWEMGDTGPCGPCSEIHLDLDDPSLGAEANFDTQIESDGLSGRYMELWNLVFIQYNRDKSGKLSPLPAMHVDTGAGLERITATLQGTRSNYDTDLFQPILQKIAALSEVPYEDGPTGTPHRVMADHIRTLVFAIADNVRPSNEGRGYVLRRLLRRGLRYAKTIGFNDPVMFKLVQVVVDIMGDFYPHIKDRQDYIEQMIQSEEVSFLNTLESGISRFDEVVTAMKSKNQTLISGQDAFKLYDTFGFPVDLTQVMATEQGLTVDLDGFDKALTVQKERSRGARKSSSDEDAVTVSDASLVADDVTEEEANSVLKGVYIDAPGGGEARLPATEVERFLLSRHHTGTHLLNQALRDVLGDHVVQAGSLVDVDRLRFDFSHFKGLSKQELTQVETIVNDKIKENIAVTQVEMPIDEAKKTGAMAMFGEKYDDIVRVVSIGDYSRELCGGNHVNATGTLQQIRILSEGAVAAGTRRIEAILGNSLIQLLDDQSRQNKLVTVLKKQKQIQTLVKTVGDQAEAHWVALSKQSLDGASLKELDGLEEQLTSTIKQGEKALNKSQQSTASDLLDDLKKDITPLASGKGNIVTKVLDDADIPLLRNISDTLLNYDPTLVALLGSKKGFLIVKVGESLKEQFPAGDLLKQITAISGGKGGGRPDMAQAGGVDGNTLESAFQTVTQSL
ncbi:alanine--tRNA ligase [bacterium]|jgi:alanyl-tRNA synthetase|nr:alanine--tRNA ligase [bacterium]